MDSQIQDKLTKLAKLATNEGAAEGEWRAAAVRFFAVLRDKEFSIYDYTPAEKRETEITYYPPQKRPWWSSQRMVFGKYKGRTVQWIRDNDASYLRWLLDNVNFRQTELEEAVEAALDSCGPDDHHEHYDEEHESDWPDNEWT